MHGEKLVPIVKSWISKSVTSQKTIPKKMFLHKEVLILKYANVVNCEGYFMKAIFVITRENDIFTQCIAATFHLSLRF